MDNFYHRGSALNVVRLAESVMPSFCLLMSSLSAVLGGLGFASYAGANALLDALATRQARTSKTRWISVQWEGWDFKLSPPGAPSGIAHMALSPDEGLDVFDRVLALEPLACVAVSTADLEARRAQSVGPKPRPAPQAGAAHHARPPLVEPYQAPRSQSERDLVTIWESLLGVAPVGVCDDFFELGGHSLLATQAVTRARTRFQLDIPLNWVFDHPTVAQQAEWVSSLQRATSAVTPGPGQGDTRPGREELTL